MSIRYVVHVAAAMCALLIGVHAVRAEPDLTPAAAFQKRLERAIRATEGSPEMHGMSYLQRRAIIEFVAGNMLFTLLHEMGHTHITEMGLPVLGREEDAADSFAVVTMRDDREGASLTFYDVHGLDKQRAFEIVCLMVGSDPDRFLDLASKVGLPEERQETCRGDYSNASWSWEMVMKPHLRAAGKPKTTITTNYGKGEDDLGVFEQTFRAMRLLETVADYAADRYVWRRPFEMEMQTCGTANAKWDLGTRKLTLCYELAAEFSQLYRSFGNLVMLPLEASAPAP